MEHQHVVAIRPNAPRAPCSKMPHSNERYAERVMPRFDASSALATGASGDRAAAVTALRRSRHNRYSLLSFCLRRQSPWPMTSWRAASAMRLPTTSCARWCRRTTPTSTPPSSTSTSRRTRRTRSTSSPGRPSWPSIGRRTKRGLPSVGKSAPTRTCRASGNPTGSRAMCSDSPARISRAARARPR